MLNELEFGEQEIMFEHFDIVELIRSILLSNNLLIQQKKVDVQLETSGPTYVWGDEYKVEQVICNYLSNALNHVKYDNKISIQVTCDKEREKVRYLIQEILFRRKLLSIFGISSIRLIKHAHENMVGMELVCQL